MESPPNSPDVQGDLARYPLPRLMYFLCRKRFTGRLEVERPGLSAASVYFCDGLPARCDVPGSTEDVLGQVMLERGWINASALNRSLELLAQGKGLQGQILLSLGAIDPRQLISGLNLQLRRKLIRLFSLRQSAFRICSGPHQFGQEGEAQHVRADPLWVICQGVRNAYDGPRLDAELSQLTACSVALQPGFERLTQRYGFAEEESSVLALLGRGEIRLERLLQVSDLSPVQSRMLIYTLWATEALLVSGGKPSEQVSPPQAMSAQPIGRGTAARAPDEGMPHEHDAAQQAPASVAAPVPEATFDAPVEAQAATPAPPESTTPEVAEPPHQRFVRIPTAGQVVVLEGAIPPRAPEGASAPKVAAPVAPAAAVAPSAPAAKPAARASGPAPASAGSKVPPPEKPNNSEARNTIETTYAELEQFDYFELLGVRRDASAASVRDAYFRLAKLYHPDRLSALGLQDLAEKAAEVFRRVNVAHKTLTDNNARSEYVRKLEGGEDEDADAGRRALEAEMYFQKGLVLLRKRNYAEAQSQFETALDLNPEEGEHVAYVAWAEFCNPKTDRDRRAADIKARMLHAINMSPKSASCHYFLGEVYLSMEDTKRAITCFKKVLEIKPNHTEAERHLRLINMRKDRGKTSESGGLFGRLKRK